MPSPTDFKMAKVSGIPKRDTTIHKSWPAGVRGVILPYPAENAKKKKRKRELGKNQPYERFIQRVCRGVGVEVK